VVFAQRLHHKFRTAVIPSVVEATAPRGCRRFDWAALMKRVFAVDVLVCDRCGGPMRILAVLPEGDATGAILEHLGLPTEPPSPRAHAPPRSFDDVAPERQWDA
jgi:hypothetical protein